MDAVVPITGTRYGVESMNLTKTEDWFSWYVNGQVRIGTNLVFNLFLGANSRRSGNGINRFYNALDHTLFYIFLV